MRDHIIVVGAGKFGSYLANYLSIKGRDVVLIDKNQDAFSQIADSFFGIQIVGDAVECSILEEAEITKAAQIIIVTDNDNTNIFIANICKKIYDVPKIFLRQSNNDKAGILAGYNFKVIYPFNLSIQEYFDLAGDED